MVKILFVCLGNICRSPAGEGVMNKLTANYHLDSRIGCDSAGTSGYHNGQQADHRMREVATQRNIEILSRSRQITHHDLETFDYIIAMDDDNYHEIQALDHDDQYNHKILRLRDFCTDHEVTGVPDPYYGGKAGFEKVLDILQDGCLGLLDKIREEKGF